MSERMIPGTVISYSGDGIGFAYFRPLMQVTDGLTLSQVRALTGLETSTIQNWVKRGYVPRPVNKMYKERHLARILLISSLRDSMQIDRVGELMTFINGDADDESDDIISEEKLYDVFCCVISEISAACPGDDDIRRIVIQECKTVEMIDRSARERLTEALCVMVYAYTSGVLKKKCEESFQKLSKCMM